MSRNAVITSRLVITLSRIRQKKDKLAENSFRNYAPIKEIQPIATSYIDLDIVNQSLRGYPTNKLFQFLSAQFGETETLKPHEEIQGWYIQILGRCNRILADGQSE